MKNRKTKLSFYFHLVLLSFLTLTLFWPSLIVADYIPKRPSPAVFVNDYTGKLDDEKKQALELKLLQFSNKTSNQIVVVIIDSLDGAVLEDYTHQLAQKWGVGQKESENGLLIFTSLKDRKIRIEVGYGLEEIIPDATAKRIIDRIIVPEFRGGNFYNAFDKSTNYIIKRINSSLAGNKSGVISENELPIPEDHEAVWGGRIMVYGFWGFVILFTFIHYLSKFGGYRRLGLLMVFSMLTLLVVDELLFYSSHGAWFWLLQSFGPFCITIFFFPMLNKYVKQEANYNWLKNHTKDIEKWKQFQERYVNEQVLQKFQDYHKVLEHKNIKVIDTKKIRKLREEIEHIFKNPGEFFREKSNLKLVEMNSEIVKSKVLLNELYLSSKRKKWTDYLTQKIDYFEALAEHELIKEDRSKLEMVLANCKSLQDDPRKELDLDENWLTDTIETFMLNKGRWVGFKKTYTKDSIARTEEKFDLQYANLIKMPIGKGRTEASLNFYTDYVKKIKTSPLSFLTKIYIAPISYSSSSSSSSWGSSSSSWSSSSSSSSFSSSSDFGGGSFGGGGASGSW